MKLPAFQFYPGDWRKDPGVQALNFNDRGIWLEMICLMHESEERGKLMLNGAPMPEDALARLLGLDKQNLTTTLTTLLTYGVASRCDESGAIVCRRMIRDENLRKIRTDAGKKGGNPVLLNQKPTTHLKQKSTPSSSSSSSSSKKEDSLPLPFSSEKFKQTWSLWLTHKKEIGQKMPPTTIALQLKKCAKWGELKAIAAIEEAISNKWQGLFEPKQTQANASQGSLSRNLSSADVGI